jgi:hypothetical protein
MRIILFISVLIFATTLQGVAQSKLVPVSRSPLTGIELPANTQQDNRILSTASARTLLKMKAEENALTTGEQVEVFSMPPSTGNQTIDKVKIAAQQAGWEVRPFTNEVTYSLLVNNQRTVLMYIESLKKETALYFLIVTSPAPAPSTKNSSTTEVMAQPKPTETPVKTETLNQTQTPVVVPAVATKQQEDKTSVSTTSTSSAAATDNAYFTYSTINFDDGWTSTIEEDWVKVAKGNTLVLLYFPIQITDEIRASNLEMRDYFWNSLVVPNYTIKSAYPLNESLTYFKVHFTEGEAIDRSGKPVYLALTVLVNSGIASPVLAISPDKNSYYQYFPEPKNLGNMTGYNRFAVGARDVVGNWSASSSAGVSLYNSYTGNYAGMNYASSTDSFTFNSDGTYSSKHAGASSVYGSTTVYQQEYKGKLTVTNWEMSLTNRWKEATDNFHIWFEVVRGGRILHLQNKTASGIQYHLVKVN